MYTVKFYEGDYRERQVAANKDKCVAYVEHHFNSSTSPEARYTVVITGSNASQTSRNWGRWYSQAIAREFDTTVGGDQGILVGGFNGRGDFNLRFTDMPAILLEPLFASNPLHAEIIKSEAGQIRLATVLCDSIRRFFQGGGLIGFSVGHKYKRSNPNDRGAPIAGGGVEADFAERVLLKAEAMLEMVEEADRERRIRVFLGQQELWSHAIDADANVSWDGTRGILRIDGGPGVSAPRALPGARESLDTPVRAARKSSSRKKRATKSRRRVRRTPPE